MLISDSHRLILMLPQKCGTSTLQLRLKSIQDVKEFGSGPSYNKELGKLLTKHVKLKHALKLQVLQSRPNHLKACFVRNPYDRVYSWFLWTIRSNQKEIKQLTEADDPDSINPRTGISNAARLEGALRTRKKLEEVDYDFNRFMTKKPKRYTRISSFTHHQGINHIDFIGRVESFEEDFDRLCDQISFTPEHRQNINYSKDLEDMKNKSNQYPEYIDHYSTKTLAVVNRVHSVDFKNFGYKKKSSLVHFFRNASTEVRTSSS